MASPFCPRCLRAYHLGEPACPCGRLLDSVAPEPLPADGLPDLEPHGDVPPVRTVFRLRHVGPAGVRFQGKKATEIVVETSPLRIGRRDVTRNVHPEIDLGELADWGYTARRHAELRLAGGRLFVVDVADSRATAVNDVAKPIPAHVPVPLAHGDRLIIGDVVTFEVEIVDEDVTA